MEPLKTVHLYNPLFSGATIALIAPASPPKSESHIHQAVAYLEQRGFRVIVGKSCYAKELNFLAGSDQQRAEELTEFFLNPEIHAIFTLRGGYGSLRILHLLPYDEIARTRKLLVGFSDITALQSALFRYANLVTLSAPFPHQLASKKASETEKLFWRYAMEGIPKRISVPQCRVYRAENTTGHFLCGTLTLFVALLGTPFSPFDVPAILLCEDVNEPLYRLDRAFRQLWLSQARASLQALLFGEFSLPEWERKELLPLLLQQYADIFALPAFTISGYGHPAPGIPFPFGLPVRLAAEDQRLEFHILTEHISP